MILLTEEIGEMARIVARKYGEQSTKPNEKLDMEDEIADVLWVLTCIANQTNIDLTKALEKNMEKKTTRDNKRHLENKKLK
jgi:NTP pyrophosphatase (non-canonical NTP hydrolase)